MAQPISTISDPSIQLEESDVHIWWVSLAPRAETLVEWRALLSADEQARAERYYFERDRVRFIAGRAFLRIRLGAYLGVDPARIAFDYSPLGKPALKMTVEGRTLLFNFSNSADRAVAVFHWQQPLGIDLEWLHPMPDEDGFARQFFCAAEIALLGSRKGMAKRKTFFELWTCKEALLKAMGDGLNRPINEVEVLLEGGTARLVSIAGDPAPASAWQLTLFRPAPGFQAALATTVSDGPKAVRLEFFDAAGDLRLDKDTGHRNHHPRVSENMPFA